MNILKRIEGDAERCDEREEACVEVCDEREEEDKDAVWRYFDGG